MMSKQPAALSDAAFRQGDEATTVWSSGPCVATVAPPESANRTDGGTVRYAFRADKRWYVLRCTYQRHAVARELLHASGIEYYLPMRRTYKMVQHKKRKCKEPLLSNLLFIYATEQDAAQLMSHPQNLMLHYYYDHCAFTGDGQNPPLTVPYAAMRNFILATSKPSEHSRLLTLEQGALLKGDKVRVVHGDFAGVEGIVARMGGEQRVIVHLDRVCAFATAYVPSAFLQKIH